MVRLHGFERRQNHCGWVGRINASTFIPNGEQFVEVKHRAEEHIVSLPVDAQGRKIIIESGGSQMEATLDTSQGIECHTEEIIVGQDGSLTVNEFYTDL
jgi:hypothetical protein